MIIEKIYFRTGDGLDLFGLLHKPENEGEEVVIAVHGMNGSCLKERDDILAKRLTTAGIAYFSFNNRGMGYMNKFSRVIEEKESRYIGGCIYEDIYESHYDIKAAIEQMENMGYSKLHLQGHSLGCTKIVYSYNKLDNSVLKNIKSVLLLSLIDTVGPQKYYLKGNYDKVLELAEEKEKQGKELELMPKEVFIHPISVKTYLRYYRDNELIDFAKYSDKDYGYKELNNIKVPLFMRWGNVNEMVIQSFDELIPMLKLKIRNQKLDIGYIDGADHGYWPKVEQLAGEIIRFLS